MVATTSPSRLATAAALAVLLASAKLGSSAPAHPAHADSGCSAMRHGLEA
jgi:hypothetical protein